MKKENTEQAKKELKKLERMDTYGELDFEAIIIFAQSFQEVSNFSSILPYYDVDPKKYNTLEILFGLRVKRSKNLDWSMGISRHST